MAFQIAERTAEVLLRGRVAPVLAGDRRRVDVLPRQDGAQAAQHAAFELERIERRPFERVAGDLQAGFRVPQRVGHAQPRSRATDVAEEEELRPEAAGVTPQRLGRAIRRGGIRRHDVQAAQAAHGRSDRTGEIVGERARVGEHVRVARRRLERCHREIGRAREVREALGEPRAHRRGR